MEELDRVFSKIEMKEIISTHWRSYCWLKN